jgi:hypothetical protein
MGATGVDGSLVWPPSRVMGVTLKLYAVPFVSPVTIQFVLVLPVFATSVDHVAPLSALTSIRYPWIGKVPDQEGAVHDRASSPSSGTPFWSAEAVTPVGTRGP